MKCQYVKKWIDFLCYKCLRRLGGKLWFQLHSSLFNCCTVFFQLNGNKTLKLCTILMFQTEKWRKIKRIFLSLFFLLLLSWKIAFAHAFYQNILSSRSVFDHPKQCGVNYFLFDYFYYFPTLSNLYLSFKEQ